MTFSLPRNTRLLFLGIGGAVVVIFVFIGLFILFHASPKELAADYLPRDNVAALFHGLTEKERQALVPSFPILKAVGQLSERRDIDVAILRIKDTTFGWVTFISGITRDLMSSRLPEDTPSFAIRTSGPEVTALLKPKTDTLSASPAYRSLLSTNTSSSWALLDARLIAIAPGPLDRSFLSQVQSSPLVLIAQDGGELSFSFSSKNRRPFPTIAELQPSLTPAPEFLLTIHQPQTVISSLLPLLPDPSRTTAEGLLRATWERVAGKDAGLRYDLAPLLGGESTMAQRSGTGGQLRFLLLSDPTLNQGDIAAHFTRLRESAKSLLTSNVTRLRPLTRGFVSHTLEFNPASLTEQTVQENGWIAQGMRKTTDGSSFWTAQSDDGRILITNDEAWLHAATKDFSTLTLPGSRGSLVAGGILSAHHLEQTAGDLLGFTLPGILQTTFGLQAKSFLWTLRQRGLLLTVTLRPFAERQSASSIPSPSSVEGSTSSSLTSSSSKPRKNLP